MTHHGTDLCIASQSKASGHASQMRSRSDAALRLNEASRTCGPQRIVVQSNDADAEWRFHDETDE
jgi:hypothetical protein